VRVCVRACAHMIPVIQGFWQQDMYIGFIPKTMNMGQTKTLSA